MRTLLAAAVFFGGLLVPATAPAQCCDPACFDVDGDGTDDRVSCGAPAVAPGANPGEPVIVSGCADAAPAGCVGGRTRAIGPFLEEGRLPAAGCVCAGGNCVAGDPETGAVLNDATAEQCAKGAAFFCHDAGNADVVDGDCD